MATARLTTRTVMGIATETTQGTAATLGATDFMYVKDLVIDPDVSQIERDYYRSTIGQLQSIPGETMYKVAFKTELKGSGSAGTGYAPMVATLLASGMTVSTSTATGTPVTVAPTSSATGTGFFGPGKSATVEAYFDGVKHSIVGVMGSWKLSLNTNQLAMLDFAGMGVYADPTDAAFPTQTYNTTTPAKLVSSAFACQSLNAVITKLDIDYNATVTKRVDSRAATGLQGFLITKRAPNGSFDPEMELVATHAFFSKLGTGTTGTLSCTLGATAGNIVTIAGPKVQYTAIKYADRDGLRTLDANLKFCESSGDDELTIVFT